MAETRQLPSSANELFTDITSDRAGKIKRFAITYDLPEQFVSANFDELEKINPNVTYDQLMRKYPSLKHITSTSINRAIIENDEEIARNIQKLEDESYLTKATKTVSNTAAGLTKDLLSFGKTISKQAKPWVTASRYGLKEQGQGKTIAADVVAPILDDIISSEKLKEYPVVATGTLGGIPIEQYSLDILSAGTQLTGQIIATAAGGAIGGVPGAAAVGGGLMYSTIAGGTYRRLRERGTNEEAALEIGLTNAIAQTPLEMLPVGRILSKANVTSKIFGKFAPIAETAMLEGMTEFIQQYPDAAADIWGRTEGVPIDQRADIFFNEFWDITKDAAYAGSIGAIVGGGVGTVKVGALSFEESQIKSEQEKIKRQIQLTEKLSQKSPELTEEIVRNNNNGATIEVAPAGIRLYQDEMPGLIERLGLTEEQVQEASETGTRLEIDESKYIANVPLDVHEGIKDYIATSPEGHTIEELSEIAQNTVKQAQEDILAYQERQRIETEINTEIDRIEQEIKAAAPKNIESQAIKGLTSLLEANARVMRPENPAQYLRENTPVFRKGTQEELKNQSPIQKLFQTAYHGSPYRFKNFSNDFINTGEGSQGRGYGLYFAGDKDVAESYRKRYNGRSLDNNGIINNFSLEELSIYENGTKIIQSNNIDNIITSHLLSSLENISQYYHTNSKKDLLEIKREIKSTLEKMLYANTITDKEIEEQTKKYNPKLEFALRYRENNKQIQEELANKSKILLNKINNKNFLNFKFKKESKGQLYKVDIPEEGNYLSLVGYQPEEINEKLNSLKEEAKNKGLNNFLIALEEKAPGYIIYESLFNDFKNNEKNIADFLKSAGIKGTYYLEGDVYGQGEEVPHFVVFDDKDIKILQTYYQSKGKAIFGSYHLENDRSIITLFENANASTLIHETFGHYFVESLMAEAQTETASDRIKSMAATILKEVNSDNWENATVEQKEAIAKKAEEYMMSGATPSIGLRTVFNNFKKWLLRLYGAIFKNKDLSISPDLKQTFDRIVATDEELEQMESVEGIFLKAGFSPDIYNSLPDKAKQKIIEARAKAREKAEQQVLQQNARFIRRLNSVELQEERERVAKQVQSELEAQPIYQAIKTLTAPKEQGGMKFNVSDINETYSEYVDQIPKTMVTKSGGISPTVIAESIGYDDTGKFLHDLVNASPLSQEVTRITNERLQQYKDIITAPETIRAQAEQAIYSDDGARVVAAELQIISEMVADLEAKGTQAITEQNNKAEKLIETTRLKQYLAREKEVQRTFDKAAIESAKAYEAAMWAYAKSKAYEKITSMPLSESLKTKKFIITERRFGERARFLLDKDRIQEAYEAKATQLLSYHMALESLKVREEYMKISNAMKRFQKTDIKSWHKQDHFEQAAEIMRLFGFKHKGYTQAMQESKRIGNRTLLKYVQRLNEDMDTVRIPDWIILAQEQPFLSLNIDEAKQVSSAIKNIKHVAKTEDRFFTLQEKTTISEYVSRLATQWQDKEDVYIPAVGEDAKRTGKDMAKQYFGSLKNIQGLMLEMDNFNPNGLMDTIFNRSTQISYDKYSPALYDIGIRDKELILKIFDGRDNLSKFQKLKALQQVQKYFEQEKYYPELGTSVKKKHIIELARHIGNDSNLRVLTSIPPIGLENSSLWVTPEESPEYIFQNNKKSIREANEATKENIMQFLSNNLTAQDMDYVQMCWNTFETLFPAANENQKKMSGFEIEKIPAKPFTMTFADGTTKTYDGGHMPLREDMRLGRNVATDAETALYSQGLRAWNPDTDKGYTHSRTGAIYRVDLNSGNYTNRLNVVAYDTAMRGVVTDMRRLVKNQDFKNLVERKWGVDVYKYLQSYVEDVATTGNRVGDRGKTLFDSLANWIRRRALASQLMLRIPTILLNITNIPLSAYQVEDFGFKEVGKALYEEGFANGFYGTNFFKILDETFEWIPFMRDKMIVPDASLFDASIDLNNIKSIDVVLKLGGDALAYSDMATLIPLARAAYKKKLEESGSIEDARYYASTLINRITGSGRVTDIAPLLTGSSLARLFTLFSTFVNSQLNSSLRDIGIMKKEGIRSPIFWSRLSFLVGVRILMLPIAAMFIKGTFPDFEDDEDWKKVVSEIVKNVGGAFPVIGGASSFALDRVVGANNFDYQLSPVEQTIETLTTYPSKLVKFYQGEQSTEDWIKLAEQTSKTLQVTHGLPPIFLNDIIFNTLDYLNGNMDEFGFSDLLRRRPYNERK